MQAKEWGGGKQERQLERKVEDKLWRTLISREGGYIYSEGRGRLLTCFEYGPCLLYTSDAADDWLVV